MKKLVLSSGCIGVFSLVIALLSSCPPARAASLPAGTYMQSCQQPEMHGNTLTAVCADFFGNQAGARLADADDCNSSGHDIANVNGALRCIFYWDPNGVGIVSRSKDQQKDGNVIKNWRIDQPWVLSQSAPYPDIRFKPDDTITMSAGGCVQTGGSGATWKSYTNPLGGNGPTQYSGLIQIPGVIGSLVRIGGVLNREWRVPPGLQGPTLQQLYLRLGYQDDDYPDNGYWGHDDGTNNQCLNVGPAWVEITIVRPLKTPDDDRKVWSPASKPFDLVWDAEDTQGLPLNPRWFVQGEKKDPQYMPDFAGICGSAFSGGNTVDVGLLNSICTSQMPYMDLDTSPFVGWSNPFGGPGYCTDDGFLHGHMNWALAATMGTVVFESWTTGIGEDDDYNLYLPGSDKSLVTSGDSGSHPMLALEFNSDESIDQFQSPWWANLDSTVKGLAGQGGHVTVPGDTPLGELVAGKPAVAIGLIGIDGVHGHGHVESHPVFALAIQSASHDDKDSHDETWDFFVRNFGNEGNCSELIHYWEGLGGKYYIQLPNPPQWSDVADVTVTASDAWLWAAALVDYGLHAAEPKGGTTVVVAKDSQASYLEVSLPAPVESGPSQVGWGVNGEVTIHYALKPPRIHKENARREEARSQVSVDVKGGESEANWQAWQKRITDGAARQRVEQIFLAAFPGGKVQKHPYQHLLIDSKVHDHKPVIGVHHGALTRPHRARDPRKLKLDSDLQQALAINEPAKRQTGK
jgi:hypothetical protein